MRHQPRPSLFGLPSGDPSSPLLRRRACKSTTHLITTNSNTAPCTILYNLHSRTRRNPNLTTNSTPHNRPPFPSYASSSRAPPAQAQCRQQRPRPKASSTTTPSPSSANRTAHTARPQKRRSPRWAQTSTPSSLIKSVSDLSIHIL
jgi:hypothetical protein